MLWKFICFTKNKLPFRVPLNLIKNMNNKVVEISGFQFLLDEKDSLGLSSQNLFEPETFSALNKIIKPGMCSIDVGANIGYFTVFMSNWSNNHGKVYAIEPNALNFDLLSKNVKLNGCNNIELFNIAVGENTGVLPLFLSEYNGGMHRLYPSELCTNQTEEIVVRRLDEIFQDQKIDLIKIDIEGFEYFALKGAVEILKKNISIKIISEYCPASCLEAGAKPSNLLLFLEKMGFHVFDTKANEIPYQELYKDARIYEDYGKDRFVNECHGKSNPEILEYIISFSESMGCTRPILEELIFSREKPW